MERKTVGDGMFYGRGVVDNVVAAKQKIRLLFSKSPGSGLI